CAAGRPLEPIRQQLAEAGIRARLVPLTFDELSEQMEAGAAPFRYAVLVTETADASDVLDSMAHSPEPARGWGLSTFSGYANPELEGWSEQSGVVGSPRDRRDTLQRCLRTLTRDLPFIPLFVPHEIYGVSDDLTFEPRLDGNLLAQEMRRRESSLRRARVAPSVPPSLQSFAVAVHFCPVKRGHHGSIPRLRGCSGGVRCWRGRGVRFPALRGLCDRREQSARARVRPGPQSPQDDSFQRSRLDHPWP